ncbi:MAG TPA: Na+/H+ antiporter NhaC family protein [Thermoclostridium caenicola]|uniref:Na+/H+ antiporter NhaC family protein n=1 Tax=Thermoclostridium caenicola TaxID=659425 RepID=UPI002B7D505D|nr:Na+/H+ antiporter NhaC family protein [Thermoclostridium caenicola]HOK43432.1 Na+/H+ antiporter NhaC family protein [Thermoclostridium caenicola]HOL84325.1 Na+/H+ antiporter NhaC family protein [Thermoclostridium caenicola]HPO76635.1 Na+/H+ antiporter NhaC family protein [Thermoclostridium caenicola]HPU22443.1 Na+/H+ antiporter NhaC family protein [Thermoclostridium caenicola]
MKPRKLLLLLLVLAAILTVFALPVFAEDASGEESQSFVYGTFWALLPPIIAIVLALITKEVYSSLFIGILSAALLYANFNPVNAFTVMLNDGFIASLADSWNVGILIFLVVLGTIVCLMNQAGGSAAYGEWASRRIKTRKGAILSTFGLGVLIFVDDYFNCLTVGNVMRPITDKHRISRAKLAYLVDATAAPICMIAPISSWAAAVTGVVEGYDGFELFIRAIPYNLYSLLTLAMILIIAFLGIEYGPMRKHEENALNGDLYTTPDRPFEGQENQARNTKGKVRDLVIPVIVLIVCCILGMLYTGGILEGENIVNAFANCDASLGLSLGSVLALIIIIIYFIGRKVLSFNECMACLPNGFKAMVPAILILTFAWTLSGLTKSLGSSEFVSGIFNESAATVFLPAIVFAVAVGMSFATGTSWGTFGILLPLVVDLFDKSAAFSGGTPDLLIVTISACLAGAVCGDHCSPISDTTIMSSTGAMCSHINHVSTQLPYALTVAAVSFLGYILAGFIPSAWVVLPISLVVLFSVLMIIRAAVPSIKGGEAGKSAAR